MTGSEPTPADAQHQDLPRNRTLDPSWRWRLLLLDGVLAIGLAWVLWDLFQGRAEFEAAKAAEEAQAIEDPAGV